MCAREREYESVRVGVRVCVCEGCCMGPCLCGLCMSVCKGGDQSLMNEC